MVEKTNTFIISLIVIILGVIYNQLWLSFVIGAVMLLVLLSPEKKQEQKSQSPSVIIKPIKVQRKYKEGETIYPEKMEIKIKSGGYKKEERGPEAVGKLFGKAARFILNKFKED